MTRIIAGSLRGRTLVAPKGDATRPTSDKVRESLFSALEAMDMIAGSTVLDLYAGTGALGLEAVSRGASRATLVDSGRRANEAIGANIENLAVADRVRSVNRPVAAFLAGPAFESDVVFADPPYPMPEDEITAMLAALVGGWLVGHSVVLLERSARGPEPKLPEGLRTFRTRTWGETAVHFLELD